MHEPINDPAHLTFRSRNHARAGRQGSQVVWIVVALVGAVLFVLLIRTLLERTSATIGRSRRRQLTWIRPRTDPVSESKINLTPFQ